MSDKVYIFDTTLRDGEQVPGCQLTTLEKVEIARELEILGVDVLEAGFPISSPGDFHSVVEISKSVNDLVVCALTRGVEKDIDAAAESLKYAKRGRIHTGIGASDYHIKYKFNSTRENILERAIRAVKYAKKFVEDVEFYAEDAGRADLVFLAQMVESVIAAGATVVNIPDTTGFCLPEEYGNRIKYLKNNVKNIDNAIISVHCHNDLGLATANTLSGLRNGARQVECTVNGIGERAGNTALEEVTMALKKHEELNLYTSLNAKKLYSLSMLVSRLMRMPVQPNKAIVGRNAFAHSSGIHQDGILKNRESYEIISPQEVGVQSNTIILTARSGRAALKYKLSLLGYTFTKEQLDTIYEDFLKMADEKKTIHDDDLISLVKGNKSEKPLELKRLQVVSGHPLQPLATIHLRLRDKEYIDTSYGNGPLDAALKAVDKIVKKKVRLEEFLIHAFTGGTDDNGKVHLQVVHQNKIYFGFSANTDIVLASVNAYIDALNKII